MYAESVVVMLLGCNDHARTLTLSLLHCSGLSNRIDGNDRAMEAPAAMRSTEGKSTSAISRPGLSVADGAQG